jgi:hypothetical protein
MDVAPRPPANGAGPVEDEEAAVSVPSPVIHATLPEVGQSPPLSRKYFLILEALAIFSTVRWFWSAAVAS